MTGIEREIVCLCKDFYVLYDEGEAGGSALCLEAQGREACGRVLPNSIPFRQSHFNQTEPLHLGLEIGIRRKNPVVYEVLYPNARSL
jgi:hypothetical protein